MNLETIYPEIPGLPYVITEHSGLAEYIGYFFALAIIASGVLAVIVLTIGGIRLIMSGGNPTGRKEATDMIKGSVLGMVLVVSSFMILRTINPVFVEELKLTELPPTQGIYYFNGADRRPSPMAETNYRNIPEGYSQILYDCTEGPDLFIWKFSELNFGNPETASIQTVECGGTGDIGGVGSFKMAFKTPGIYYFLGEGCTGYMSQANTAGGQLPEPFKNKVKSIKIVNNISSNILYGLIFHATNSSSSSGPCSVPFLILNPAQEEACSTAEIPVSASATFFVWNGATPETSGTGVNFYSEPWGEFLGARAGKLALSQSVINNYWAGTAESLKFTSYKTGRPPEYRALYKNFFQKPGSISLKGNYLIALYSESQNCQVFFTDIFNIKQTEFLATGNWPTFISVIPIK